MTSTAPAGDFFIQPSRTIIGHLEAMARDVPVERLTLQGLHAWPLVAAYVGFKFVYSLDIFSKDYQREEPPIQDDRTLLVSGLDVERRIRELPRLDGRGCLTFTQRGDSRQRVGGRLYDHRLDPLSEVLDRYEPGLWIETTYGWSEAPEPAEEREKAQRHLTTHALDAQPFVMRAARRNGEWEKADLISVPTQWLRRQGLVANDQALALEPRELALFLGTYEMCHQVLRRVRPRMVLVCGSIGYHTAAMTAAAKSLSIPVIDHDDAPRVPAEADIPIFRHLSQEARKHLHVFPDYVWVLDATSKRLAIDCNGFREDQVFVGHAWRARCLAVASSAGIPLPGAKHRVLVSLWPGSQMPAFLLRAMRLAGKDVGWLLRVHPSHANEREQHGWEPGSEEVGVGRLWEEKGVLGESVELCGTLCTTQLSRAGVEHFDIALSSTLPLYALLPHVQHHVTAHSTVAVDADLFGLRTSFIDANGAVFLPNLIATDAARLCLSTEALLDHFRESFARDVKPEFQGDGSPPLEQEVSKLLRAIGAPEPHQDRQGAALSFRQAPPLAAGIAPPLAHAGTVQCTDASRSKSGSVTSAQNEEPRSLQVRQQDRGTLHRFLRSSKSGLRPIKCLACGSNEWLKLGSLPGAVEERKVFTSRAVPLQWSVCRRCGFVCQNPRLEEADYEAACQQTLRPGDDETEFEINEHRRTWAPWPLRRLEPWLASLGIDLSKRSLTNCLDYGCGVGGALEYLAGPGRKMWGIETSERLARYANEHFNIEVRRRLEDLPADLNYDFIFSDSALQCLYDPNVFLRFCKKHLKRTRGLLLVVVPTWRHANTDRVLAEFNCWHNSMFDHVSLARLFNKHGMFLMAHRYQDANPQGGREICALACKSERTNHYSVSIEEIRTEIENIVHLRGQPGIQSDPSLGDIVDVVS